MPVPGFTARLLEVGKDLAPFFSLSFSSVMERFDVVEEWKVKLAREWFSAVRWRMVERTGGED